MMSRRPEYVVQKLLFDLDKGDYAMYAIFSHKTKKRVSPWFTTKAMCWAEAMSRGYVFKEPCDTTGLSHWMINHYFSEIL